MRQLLLPLSILLLAGACTALTGVTDLNVGPEGSTSGGGNVSDGSVPVQDATASSSSLSSSSSSSSSSSGSDGSPPEPIMDSGADPPPDAPPPIVTVPITHECVPVGTDGSQGILLNADAWIGFRFQVAGAQTMTTSSIGVRANIDMGGKLFGAILKLSGANDVPDSNNLSTSDVIKFVTIDVVSGVNGAQNISAPYVTNLTPGWYAVVFGAGAHGGSIQASGTVPFQSNGGACTSSGGFPFSLQQSSGMLINQAATPHLEVKGTRPQ